MKKIFTFLMVLLAAVNLSAQGYQSPISVTDYTLADWDYLPAEYLATTTHVEDASMDGLKSVKVYADEMYINLLVEVNDEVITERDWTPFHVYFNADNNATTGGFGDQWTTADVDVMLETAIFADGWHSQYNPAVFKWWGADGESGWLWTDPEVEGTSENGWGALVPEGSMPIGQSQMVDGKIEIQLLRELIPANWADQFTVGFDILQYWSPVGILPNAADAEDGSMVLAEKLLVKIDHTAYAGYRTNIDGLTYEITDLEAHTVAIVDCRDWLTTANIPSSVIIKDISYSVTSIGDWAFENCYNLTSVTIPNSVTSIGNWAFSDCYNLTSVTIPNSVTEIGYSAFYGCSSLTTPIYNAHLFAYMPRSYKGAYIIPDGIKQIANYAFESCSSLTSITIPNSVTSIGGWAFESCSSLTSITIPNSVTTIEDWAFAGSMIESLSLPNGLSTLGTGITYACPALTYLSIPSTVQNFTGYEKYTFLLECPNLQTLICPANMFVLDEYYMESDYNYQEVLNEILPYYPTALKNLVINSGELPRFAWDVIKHYRQTLKSIDLMNAQCPKLPDEIFYNYYNLENLVLPAGITTIPYMAAASCKHLQSLTIPASVEVIGESAFENCRLLSEINFAENGALTEIDNWAFYNCHELKNVVIPEGVAHVGYAAFYGCTYLEEMTLPSTMKEVGDNGFGLCAKMKKMHVNANTPPTIQAKTFEDVDRSIPVYVPTEAVDSYKADPYWSEFNIQSEDNGLENITNPNASSSMKIFYDGQLLILRDGKTYNVIGAEIK